MSKNRKALTLPLVLLYGNVLLYFIAVSMSESIIARCTAYLGGDSFQVGFIWSTLFLTSPLLRAVSAYISGSEYHSLMLASGPLVACLGAFIIGHADNLVPVAVGRTLQGVASTIYIPASISSASIPASPEILGMVLGLTCMTLSSTVPVYHPYPPVSYVSAILLGLGFSPLIPATQYLVLSNMPREHRGIAIGFYAMGFDLGNLVGPMSLGKLAQHLGGYLSVFPVLPLFTIIVLLLLLALCRCKRG